MTTTPEQIMAKIYGAALKIMILLLVAGGVASYLQTEVAGFDVATMLMKFYMLVIPAALFAFTIMMFARRVMNLAIAGATLSVSWLVFKWMG